MRKNSVSSITYGALFCALVGVLLYANKIFANAFELYFFWIIPLPVIIYVLKFGVKQTFVLDAALLLMTMIICGPISTSAFYVLGSIICGTIYGDGLVRGKSSAYLICSVILVSLIMMVITTFVFAKFFGYDIAEEIQFTIDYAKEYASAMATDQTVLDALLATFTYKRIFTFVVLSYVLSSCLEGVLVHLLAFLLLKRLKMQTPPMKSIAEIYCPKWGRVVIFAGIFGGLMAKITGVTQYDDILMVLQLITFFCCYIFGYLFVITYLSALIPDKKKRGLLTLVIILLSFIFSYVLIGIGLLDIFTDKRKRFIQGVRERAQQQNGQN